MTLALLAAVAAQDCQSMYAEPVPSDWLPPAETSQELVEAYRLLDPLVLSQHPVPQDSGAALQAAFDADQHLLDHPEERVCVSAQSVVPLGRAGGPIAPGPVLVQDLQTGAIYSVRVDGPGRVLLDRLSWSRVGVSIGAQTVPPPNDLAADVRLGPQVMLFASRGERVQAQVGVGAGTRIEVHQLEVTGQQVWTPARTAFTEVGLGYSLRSRSLELWLGGHGGLVLGGDALAPYVGPAASLRSMRVPGAGPLFAGLVSAVDFSPAYSKPSASLGLEMGVLWPSS